MLSSVVLTRAWLAWGSSLRRLLFAQDDMNYTWMRSKQVWGAVL